MCGQCDGTEPATILITPLNGADSIPIGNECLPVTMTGMLAAIVGVDAEALWGKIEQLHKAAQASQDGQGDAATSPARPERRRAGASGHAPGGRATPPARKAAKQQPTGADGQAQTEQAGQS